MDCPEYPLDQIAPDPHQPRKVFDEAALAELTESVRARGVLQPIVLTRNSDPEALPYLILYGERRYRASLAAGLTTIPAFLEERELDPAERLFRQLDENDIRQDLSLLERAQSLARLLETSALSRQELASRLGKSSSWLSHILSVANFKGPALDAVASRVISRPETGRRFARLPEPAQAHLLAYARSRNLPITAAIVASAEERHRRREQALTTPPTTVRLELALPELQYLLTLAGLPLDPTLEGAAGAL
ncbi:MAG: ParB family transcriptional regulator, chromosome partitioning protein, partial [Acidobacteriota bacterium]|nr:ParB family transcriptional regulator, chromosome partitioning protein [Acidobacteriota bacterium]